MIGLPQVFALQKFGLKFSAIAFKRMIIIFSNDFSSGLTGAVWSPYVQFDQNSRASSKVRELQKQFEERSIDYRMSHTACVTPCNLHAV